MDSRRRVLVAWLVVNALLVVCMVGVGGFTRLTRSGLSIVEWKPITGVLPPIGEAQWQAAFDAYRASPEGRLVNHAMTLDEFEFIFLVEWFHRLLGRFVGVAFGGPLAFFALRRWLSRDQLVRYVGLLLLGGAQGAMGWFMVKSGLVDVPHVSPYRLTAHLGLALAAMSGLWWEAWRLWRPREALPSSPGPAWAPRAFLGLLGVTLGWGGLMAGHKAGWVSDTWPLMFGELLPGAALASLGPAGFATDPVLVHFAHRWLGALLLAAAVAAFLSARRGHALEQRAGLAVLALALLQAGLGIATVLLHVPTWLGVAHQVNGALLLAAAVSLAYLHPRR